MSNIGHDWKRLMHFRSIPCCIILIYISLINHLLQRKATSGTYNVLVRQFKLKIYKHWNDWKTEYKIQIVQIYIKTKELLKTNFTVLQ